MVDTTNLSNTGTELGGFFQNLGPGLGDFLITMGIIGGIVSIIVAIAFVVKRTVSKGT